MSFIDLSLAISMWSLAALLLTAVGMVTMWPRSGAFITRLWRGAASKIARKRN